MEWQEIDTAPKDGTQVLISGFVKNDPMDDRWVDVAMFFEGAWRVSVLDEDGFYPPTHWMPLPEPPQAKEEQ